MLKNKLRWFIVWSSRPPLIAVYRGMYWLVIRLTILVLRRYRSITALYLSRGCGKNTITPGISDIDFTIFLTNDSKEREAIQRTNHILEKVSGGLIDLGNPMTLDTMQMRWRTTPTWHYRFLEGRTTWQLLYGTDVLPSLPPLTEIRRRIGCYSELNRWWVTYAQIMFGTKDRQQGYFLQNAACYKTVSELLNAQWALQTGQYRYSRAETLAAADFPLARRLMDMAAHRFLIRDDPLEDDTFAFVVKFLLDFWDDFREHAFLQIYPDVRQSVDCPESEIHVGEKERQHLRALQQHLDTHWGPRCTGTHLVKSAFGDFDDLLWIMDADLNRLPTVQQIADITALHDRVWRKLSQTIVLFLRVEAVAFPISPLLPVELRRGLLTPATVPDVFLQLGHDTVYWTDYMLWYLTNWKACQKRMDVWEVSAHKQQQLCSILKSAESGHIVYPLTLPALERTTQKAI
jgi:hypothetical protein